MVSGQAVATVLFPVKDIEPATDGCRGLSCEFAGFVIDPSVVAGIVFIGVGVLVGLGHVRSASEACQCERHRVLNECDAFKEFADRVAALNPVSVVSAIATAGGSSTKHHQTIRSGNATDSTLRRVVLIYKETVMSVPHYEAGYDETVPESMAAELSPDTAASLATNSRTSSWYASRRRSRNHIAQR
ncbi:DUF7260 family protein [Haloarcula brevis]